ncbi:hypothetical protein FB451DRAFT_1491954 [Mycena latifolia]|nr:hypothetical protein FB451DRAFT_1491954 [Mycena latifolia]
MNVRERLNKAFPKDRLSTKLLVYSIYTIELVGTILQTHDAFETFGYGFGNFLAATTIKLGWLDIPVISGLVAFIGQSFYAYRVYVLSKSWIIPALIMIVSLTSSVSAFLAGAFSFAPDNVVRLSTPKVTAAVGVWCGASALSDILIAICMTYYLSNQVTGFRQTRALLSKLIRITLETGSLTALVAVTNLVVFLAFPNQTYYIIPTVLMARLYPSCMLVVLNSRCQIVGGRGTYLESTDGMLSTPSYLRTPGSRGAGTNDTHLVTINREVWSDAATHDHVEMKGMGVRNAPDVGTLV